MIASISRHCGEFGSLYSGNGSQGLTVYNILFINSAPGQPLMLVLTRSKRESLESIFTPFPFIVDTRNRPSGTGTLQRTSSLLASLNRGFGSITGSPDTG